jgi:hypothetical protein
LLNHVVCLCRQQPQQLEQQPPQQQPKQQQEVQQEDSQLQLSNQAQPEHDALVAASDASAHALHDQAWPKQRCKALELLQARINEYGQHSSNSSCSSSNSRGSSILRLERELQLARPSEVLKTPYEDEDDEDEQVWRMLPDAVFVDVYDRLSPAAQG